MQCRLLQILLGALRVNVSPTHRSNEEIRLIQKTGEAGERTIGIIAPPLYSLFGVV